MKQYANPELQAELARTAGLAIIRLGGNRLSERWLTRIEALKDIGLITDDDGGSHTYDPWGYPDVYFLIDKDGILQAVDLTPHVTMRKILAFAASVQS